jgi:menaquinol-cytochrome c reductase iron-sulfur subunit
MSLNRSEETKMENTNEPKSAPEAEGTTRRSFHVGAIYAIGALITAALGAPAAAYLLLGPKPRKTEDWIELGNVAKLPVNQPIEMVGRRNRTDGWKVISEKVTAWVVKSPNGNVVAFGPQCTHLGCAHHWDDNKDKFVCPCHNSLFAKDGKVLSGPAPRPLDRYEVRVEGEKLLLGSLRRNPGQSA